MSTLTKCATCGKRFGSYHAMQQHAAAVHGGERSDFATIQRYWDDPEFRAQCEEERRVKQAEVYAAMDRAQRRAWERMGIRHDD